MNRIPPLTPQQIAAQKDRPRFMAAFFQYRKLKQAMMTTPDFKGYLLNGSKLYQLCRDFGFVEYPPRSLFKD